MSSKKKNAITYAKALFQNVLRQSYIRLIYPHSEFQTLTTSKSGEKEFGSTFNASLSNIIKPSHTSFFSTIYMVGEELMLLRTILRSCKKVGDLCKNPTIDEKRKEQLLVSFFPGLTLTTRSFLKLLAERSDISLLPEICEEFQKILLKYKKVIQVKMTTGSSLLMVSGYLLLDTLKKVTGAEEVLLTVSYDPNLLGGFILEYNSVALDASLLNELSLFVSEI